MTVGVFVLKTALLEATGHMYIAFLLISTLYPAR